MPFLYVKENDEYNNKYKYGYTNNPQQRLHDAHDALSYVSRYIELYEISLHPNMKQNWEFDIIFSKISQDITQIENIEKYYNHRLSHLREFGQYVVKNGGGTEFMRKDGLQLFNNVVLDEFKYFGLTIIKKYTADEIAAVNASPTPTRDNIPYIDDNLMTIISRDLAEKIRHKIQLRDYQQSIVNELIETLRKDKRASVELATGAGKTTVIFAALAELNPKNIVIISPRRILSKQNMEEKYVKTLKRNYNIVNDADGVLTDCNLVSICIQSLAKFLNKLEQLDDVMIWFDEAHWSIQAKLDKDIGDCARIHEFKNITYSCFTSATWDITNMPNDIFGRRIYAISPAELIKQKWLCNLSLRTYECGDKDVNNAQYIVEQFTKLRKTNGGVFHTTKANAKNLFKNHYELYRTNKTNVKPFIDVDDSRIFEDGENTPNYNYHSIDAYKSTPNSIVYAVQKISMGFDFPKLDFIVFADPRSSWQDIIQVVGRGTRSDCMGDGGKNKDKHLDIMLFTRYIADESPYANIVDALYALVNEYDISYDQIMIEGVGGDSRRCGKNYSGADILESMVYSLYKYKLPAFITILKRAGVTDINSYHELRDEKEHLNLPFNPFIKYGNEQFCFEMVHDVGKYYTLDEYRANIRELLTTHPECHIDDLVDRMVMLHGLNKKIPPYDPKKYYGISY